MKFLRKYIPLYIKPFTIAIMFLTVEAVCDLLQPTIMSKIVDIGVKQRDIDYIVRMGLIMLAVTGIGAVSAITRNIISSNVSQKFGASLRRDFFIKINSLSFENLDKFESASLITRLTNDVTQVQGLFHGLMRIFVKAPLLCIGSIIMATLLNPPMALILLAIVPLIGYIIYLSVKVGYPPFRKVQIKIDTLNSVMREYLAGVRVVKAFNRFDYEMDRFDKASSDLASVSAKAMRIMAVFSPLISLTVNIGIAIVLWISGYRVNSGSMEAGQVMAFINYMTQILFSLNMISFVFGMFVRAKASAERIDEVMQQDNTILPGDKLLDSSDKGSSIEFRNVTFSYTEGSGEPILKNICFKISPGETIGIIGSTGAGKTTLVNLIPRFYDSDRGSISINDVDVRELEPSVIRDMIAVVPQKSLLFTGSIIENIRWGKEDASYEEVKEAAAIAQADEFIEGFPEGYETILGQGGVNLSGGQKQRISIARALVKKPQILILDDSTSAVDGATEGAIRAGLKTFVKGLTSIVITQRITSVMGADRIIVMNNGEVTNIGTHEELLKDSQIYREIYRSQVGKEGLNG